MRALVPSWRSSVISRGVKRVLLAAALLCTDCTSAPPGAPIPTTAIDIVVVFTPTGDGSTFNATINGQGFARGGTSTISLSPGLYQISGTFTGAALTVGFQSLGASGGGVLAGSPQNLSGPASQTTPCGIKYISPGASVPMAAFQLQFQVSANASGLCPGAAP